MGWIYTANRRLSRMERLPAVICSPVGRLWGRPLYLSGTTLRPLAAT